MNLTNRANLGSAGVLAMSFAGFAMPVEAEEHDRYTISPYLNVVVSDGRPTNDILGAGVEVHRRINQDWYLGVALTHSPTFDFESTAAVVGVNQVTTQDTIDAVGSSTQLTVVGERRYAQGDGNAWFWNAGAGINSVDVDDVSGPVAGGGTFDITTDAGTEFVVLGNAGWMQSFGDNWHARYVVTLEKHFADWKVRDRNSGNTATIEDYTVAGIRLGLTYQF